ncbi:MAG: PAS domain S-box protein [Roseovarius sp.]|uniref:hybrid sensor histidine kinase/response regulator n=1 Tax=Roseovarius sp. TaxID=1486281 RepID=UPI0032EB844C
MTKAPVLSRAVLDAYNHLSLPVWLFSTESLRIVFANDAAQDWLGYAAHELQSMTIADLRPYGERRRIIDQVRQFDGLTSDAGTWTIIGKSGTRFAASFSWRKVTLDGDEAVVASIRDVTRVKHAETWAKALSIENRELDRKARLSAEHLARLFDGLPGKMLVLTPGDYRIVAATDEYAKAVMLSRESLLDQHLLELFPDDPSEPEADGERNVLASLQRVESLAVTDVMNLQRYPVRQPDGTFQERFWLPRNKPVLDADGHIIYIIHRVEDVTGVLSGADLEAGNASEANEIDLPRLADTRAVLYALQERETRLKTAERLLSLGSWEYDFQSGALNWSARVFDIYGVPHEQPPPDLDGYVALVHPDDREQMVDNYTRFFESGAPDFEFQHRIIGQDGGITHVRGVGARHTTEDREIAIGFVQDITSIKQAEEELLREARRRRLAGRLVSLGSWRVDIGDTHVTWSEETAAIHDEPDGTSPTLEDGINYYVPEHRERIRTRFDACVSEGAPFDEIVQIVTAKGRRVWVRTVGEPIRDDTGQIVAVKGAFQDITDLIAARDEAADLSARLQRTLEGMSDAFFLLDDDWNFAFVNSQAESLLQRTKEDLIGRNIWDVFPEAAGTIFQHEYERAVSEGCPVQFRESFPPLDAWFEVSADPTPAGLAVYFEDITGQRARDMQLRLLESAVSRQNDILLITEAEPIDAPGGPRIVYVNDAFERRTGYSCEEVIGQTPRILQGPKTQRDELDRIREALERWQPVRSELINYTKSGEEFWIELDIVPIADDSGRFTHWVAIERDITARKKSEEVLQANEERFRLVTKAVGTAIWDWNVENNQHWWSEGLQDIFGHAADPSGAIPTIWRQHLHPDDAARVDAATKRLISGQDTILHEQYRLRRADGSWAFVEDKAFALHDDEGKVLRVLGSMTDVTEQRHLEDRLRQAQKMETVGQLTGGVAHDFNNLLTIILGNSELLEEDLEDRPDLRSMARMTADAAERGSELTQRLLAFSRKQVLEPKIIDVAQLIQGMDGLLRRTLRKNIDIEIIRAGGLWQIEVDAAQVESAILNLCVNARDAMPNGGYLTIEVANAMLDGDYVALEPDVRPGQYVVITVTDTGHGIPADIGNRVFEPFFTTKDTGKGSGLGLSMVFGFVKQSGGHIRIYSEMHKGTAVKMYFPRSNAKPERIVTEQTRRRITGGTETILVVEDDGAVRKYVTTQLSGLGYHVLEAASGAEAMDVLTRTPVDLLFTDVVMPGTMGGRELGAAAREVYPGLRILFTSGYTENSIVHHGRLDQGVRLLSKPYRRELLAKKIREALDDAGPEVPGAD